MLMVARVNCVFVRICVCMRVCLSVYMRVVWVYVRCVHVFFFNGKVEQAKRDVVENRLKREQVFEWRVCVVCARY
jgi:hypothetical protein